MSGGKAPKPEPPKIVNPYQATVNLARVYLAQHVREDDGENRNRAGQIEHFITQIYGKKARVAWCACFGCSVVVEVKKAHGFESTFKPHAHCRTLFEINSHLIVPRPIPGVLSVWGRIGTSRGHLGIVTSEDFDTIEGNVSGDGTSSEGDGIYALKRSTHKGAWKNYEHLGFIDPWK